MSRSASVGIALDIDHSMPVDMLFARAARACDRVQAAGGDGVALFDAVAEARRTERMRLDLDLHAAVTGGQLGLHFQPEFDLATGQPLAVEALLRWQHPHLGLLSAQRFIPATEPTRTFAAVQRWVFDQCCRRLVAWREGPLAGLLLRMNVSGARLANSATVDTLLRAVDEHGVAPERLCVEITESRMPDELDPLVEQGSRLRTAGISVALDDVGTGQNTPTLLMTLPIDTMKLDRSFVAGLRSGTRYETMVQAFMGTAGSFGYQVVAEGVDGPQTVAALLELGCHRGQGNFLAPAVAEADLPEAIAAGGPGGWRSS